MRHGWGCHVSVRACLWGKCDPVMQAVIRAIMQDPATDELTSKTRTSKATATPTKTTSNTTYHTPQGRHLYRHTDYHSPSHPLHMLPPQKQGNPVALTASSVLSAGEVTGSDASISPSSSHPWEMSAGSDSGTWPPPDVDEPPPDDDGTSPAGSPDQNKLSAERLMQHNRVMGPLVPPERGSRGDAVAPPMPVVSATALLAAAAEPEAAAAVAAAALEAPGAVAAAPQPPQSDAPVDTSDGKRSRTPSPTKVNSSAGPSPQAHASRKAKPPAGPANGKPKPVWNPGGSRAASSSDWASNPASRRRRRTASAPPAQPPAADEQNPGADGPDNPQDPAAASSSAVDAGSRSTVSGTPPGPPAGRVSGGRSTRVLTRTHRNGTGGRARSLTPSAAVEESQSSAAGKPPAKPPAKPSFSGSKKEYSRLTHSQRVSTRQGMFDRAAAALRQHEAATNRSGRRSGRAAGSRRADVGSGLVWESDEGVHRDGSSLHDRRPSPRVRAGLLFGRMALVDASLSAAGVPVPAREGGRAAEESGKPLPPTVRERIRRAAESRQAARSARAYANGAAGAGDSAPIRVPEITVMQAACDVESVESAEVGEGEEEAHAGGVESPAFEQGDLRGGVDGVDDDGPQEEDETPPSRAGGTDESAGSARGARRKKRMLPTRAWTRCIRPHEGATSDEGASAGAVTDAAGTHDAGPTGDASVSDLMRRNGARQEASVGGGARALAAEQARVASGVPRAALEAA